MCLSHDGVHRFNLDGACTCRCWECWREGHGCICNWCSGVGHIACLAGINNTWNYARLLRRARFRSKLNAALFRLRIFS